MNNTVELAQHKMRALLECLERDICATAPLTAQPNISKRRNALEKMRELETQRSALVWELYASGGITLQAVGSVISAKTSKLLPAECDEALRYFRAAYDLSQGVGGGRTGVAVVRAFVVESLGHWSGPWAEAVRRHLSLRLTLRGLGEKFPNLLAP